MSRIAPAGWYPTSLDSGIERYWNGTSWTPQRRAVRATGASVASFVCGLLSLLLSPVLVGLVLGMIAWRLGSGVGANDGLAKAGRVLGLVGVVLGLIGVAALVVLGVLAYRTVSPG